MRATYYGSGNVSKFCYFMDMLFEYGHDLDMKKEGKRQINHKRMEVRSNCIAYLKDIKIYSDYIKIRAYLKNMHQCSACLRLCQAMCR